MAPSKTVLRRCHSLTVSRALTAVPCGGDMMEFSMELLSPKGTRDDDLDMCP
jgi:hypothetical protein